MDNERPLLEVITVQTGGESLMRRNASKSDMRLRGGEDASASGSSNEEMEIIANFIENVRVKDTPEAPDRGSTDEYSPSEDPGTSSDDHGSDRRVRSTTRGSKSSSRHRNPTAETSSDEPSMDQADGMNSLLVVKRSRASRRPKRIIQDMIDMSLGKKKVQSSERMLRTAFVEFYRGLGLLKSYWYSQQLLKISACDSDFVIFHRAHIR